uniref:Uncharacterized protein n=1 Tax=Mus spicilegus TaxID=10103 RepID=A0A8C6MZH5_MUSSI
SKGKTTCPISVQLPPRHYSTTPSGTHTTRIIYDWKFLMECQNSPVAKTPPKDLAAISGSLALPAVSLPCKPARATTCTAARKISGQAVKFEMDI